MQIGYEANQQLKGAYSKKNYIMDKLGGNPKFFPTINISPMCFNCKEKCLLITQLNTTVDEELERIFYVFACNNRKCLKVSGSWKVLRVLRKVTKLKKKLLTNINEKDTNGKNPLTTDASLNALSTEKKKTKSASTKKFIINDLLTFIDADNFEIPLFGSTDALNTVQNNSFAFGDAPMFGNVHFGDVSPNELSNEINNLIEERDKIYDFNEEHEEFENDNDKSNNILISEITANLNELNLVSDETNAFHFSETLIDFYYEDRESDFENDNIFYSSSDDTEEEVQKKKKRKNNYNNVKYELKLLEEYEQRTGDSKFRLFMKNDTPTPSNTEHLTKTKKPLLNTRDLNENSSSNNSITWDGEVYENIVPNFLTTEFNKFLNAIKENPDQLIRYEFNGQPLLFSSLQEVSKKEDLKIKSIFHPKSGSTIFSEIKDNALISKCQNCGSNRTFEFQLMPKVLEFLKSDELNYMSKILNNGSSGDFKKNTISGPKKNSSNKYEFSEYLNIFGSGLDFGTVLIFSCENDCFNKNIDNNLCTILDENFKSSLSITEEICIVQFEDF
ncbi:hypothetical protein HK099_002326 [Clydaea vesicula]|uniref:Programmed cell death protein 2 C-terminal domain-containing protein n=1 Tax=Clydaea vesicula TaxID=447962 RepID=A0AAD5XWU5_9FUNG|nr:hypothetical protein HK099_002326 [Clydaea vesicula]